MTEDTPLYVVTGAGSGMGRGVALSLMAQGNPVVLAGRREAPLRETIAAMVSEPSALVVAADLGTPEGAGRLADAIGERPVRAIIAAAGGQGDFYRPAFTINEAQTAWADAMQKNFYSAVLPIEGLLPRMLDGGQVILIGSTAGLDGQGGPYAAAKAAMHGYGRDLARRVGPRGITVNTIAPGFVADTEFFEAGGFGDVNKMVDWAASETMLGRVGKTDEIVRCAEWLLSDGGGWITGQVISPNGGRVIVG